MIPTPVQTHELIDHFGSQAAAARAVSVSQTTVSKWLRPEEIREKRREWNRLPSARAAQDRWRRRNRPRVNAQALERYHRKRRESPESIVAQQRRTLLRSYGITPGGYDRMLVEQGGRCAICAAEPAANRSLAIDHCHATGLVRGLLCDTCNLGLGYLGDGAAGLRRALDYLERVR